jgi:hydrogenase maturation factor
MKHLDLKLCLAAVLAAAMLGGAQPAAAHHSFAMFEPTKTLTFKATVKTFQWTNPHVIIWLVVQPAEGGAAQEWSIETTSPGVLTRNGWTRQSLKAGDRVSVVFSPLRDGSHGGGLNSVTLLDTGQTLVPSFGKEQPGLK